MILQNTHKGSRKLNIVLCRWVIAALVIAQLWGNRAPVQAQPAGYQEYYVLGYEAHIRHAFMEINDSADPAELTDGKICSTVSLVATADYQIIYYDHWEDGYEADLINPIQSTTLIFGDGNPANGGSGGDILRAGDAINLLSTQDITGTLAVNGYVPVVPSRNPADIRYDGGDRLFSIGGPVNLTHAMWPLYNSWIGGSWEVPSRQTYKDTYVYSIPVGEDLYTWGGGSTGTFGDFRNVYVQVLSYEDNTTLSLNNGSQVVNVVLDRGQTYYSPGAINSTLVAGLTINAGTVIRSNKPVQVGLITGSVSSFQSRFFTILPDRLLGAEYIVPVPSGDSAHPAEVYLFNPNDFEITVYAHDQFSQTTFAIGSSAYITSAVAYSAVRGGDIPPDTAVRLFSPDGVFGVLVCADSAQTNYDWGFTAVPAKYLAREYYVPWAPGSSQITPTVNGSPVWVAPLSNGTTFYVDFNQGGLDGLPDLEFTLNALEQQRIFDPDYDNTGMHIWATGAFAAAWGEDPRTAEVSTPYLDLGVAILPPAKEWIAPLLTIDKQAEPTILSSAGGTVTFTLITQSYDTIISDIDITDTLPISWTYVPGSTHVVYPLGGTGTPEPVIDGQALYWALDADLNLRQALTLTFQAQLTDTTQKIHINKATAVGYYSYAQTRLAPMAEAIVAISDLDLSKQVSHTDINVGDTLLYTLTYRNTSASTTMTNLLIRDILPIEYVTFVDASTGGAYDGASGAVNWSVASLAPGASASVTLTVHVNNFVRDGVQIRNVAYIDSDQTNWANSNIVLTRVHAPEVTLNKSAPTAAARGRPITYTLSYQNSGSADATNVLIWDTIPLYTTYVPGSLAIMTDTTWTALSDAVDGDAGALISSTLFISPGVASGVIAAGESGQIRFSVLISDTIPPDTLILNWATLDRDLDNPHDSNLVITRISELVLTKSVSQPATSPGSVLTYTLTLENLSSTEQQTNVYVREPIPDYTQLVAGSVYGEEIWYSWDNGATFTSTFPVTPVTHLRWYTPTVPAGAIRTLGFSVLVQDPLPPNTSIHNMAHVWSDEIITYIGQWVPSNQVVVGTVDLGIAKTASVSVVSPGETLTYTITYNNSGSLGANNTTLTDMANSAHGIAWPETQTRLVNVGAGTSGVWQVGVTVAPTATCGQVITNTALIEHTYDSSASAPVTVTVSAPYSAGFSPSTSLVCPGAPVTLANTSIGALSYEWSLGDGTLTDTLSPVHSYTLPGEYTVVLTATNLCGSDVATQTITVIGPPTAAFSPALTETWTGLPVTWTNASSDYTSLLWNLGDGTLTNDVSPSHSYALPGAYTVTLTVTSTCGVADVATGTVNVLPPVLAMSKQANAGTVGTGDVITYTIVISNLSPGYASGGVLSDTVPANTTLAPGSIGIDPPGAGLVGSPPSIIGNLALAPGAQATVTLAVRVNDTLPGGVHTITNTVTLTVVEGASASAQALVAVLAAPELQVTKSSDRPSVRPGETLTYTLVARNEGTRGASGVVLTDTLPLSVTVFSVSGGGIVGGGQVVWNLGILEAGGVLSETVVVVVSPDIPLSIDVLTNTVCITDDGANGADPILVNNSMTHTVDVHTVALAVTKSAPGSVVSPGETLTYTITYSNGGSLGVTGAVLTDTISSARGIVWPETQTRVVDIGPRSAGVWQVGVTVAPTATCGEAITNTVSLWHAQGNSVSTPVTATVSAPYSAGFAPSATTVWPGTPVTFTNTSVGALSYEWSLGDGFLTDTVSPVHSYALPGIYTVVLTATNLCGSDVATQTITVDYLPVLSLVKTGPESAHVGEQVTFILTVSHDPANSDGSPVTAVAVTDSLAGATTYVSGDDGDGLLEWGEQWIFTVNYVIRATDPTPLVNVGHVEARDLGGDLITATASHQTGIVYAPELMVIKRGPATASVGDTVVFTITVSNVAIVPTGVGAADGDGSPIYDLTVSDSVAGAATYVSGDDGDGILEFSERWVYVAVYTVRATDPNPLENVATAQGRDGNGIPVYGTAQHSTIIAYPQENYRLYFPLVFRNY